MTLFIYMSDSNVDVSRVSGGVVGCSSSVLTCRAVSGRGCSPQAPITWRSARTFSGFSGRVWRERRRSPSVLVWPGRIGRIDRSARGAPHCRGRGRAGGRGDSSPLAPVGRLWCSRVSLVTQRAEKRTWRSSRSRACWTGSGARCRRRRAGLIRRYRRRCVRTTSKLER